MSEPKKPQDDPAQSQRFLDIAHEIEADEAQESFERVFTHVASQKPSKQPLPKKPPEA